MPIVDRVIIDREPRPTSSKRDVGESYLRMAAAGGSAIARCLQLLGEPDAMPAVFHCAVGKDRTGVVAALVLSSLGVDDAEVVDDYAMSAASWEGRERYLEQHDTTFLALLRAIPPEHLESPPSTMRSFLEGLRREHGSVREFLRAIGVDDATLERLEDGLLEDVPVQGAPLQRGAAP